jgi:chromosome segregation ATPase
LQQYIQPSTTSLFEEQLNIIIKELDEIKISITSIPSSKVLRLIEEIKLEVESISAAVPLSNDDISRLYGEIKLEVESVAGTHLPSLRKEISRLLKDIKADISSVSTTQLLPLSDEISGLLNDLSNQQHKPSSEEKIAEMLHNFLHNIENNISDPLYSEVNNLKSANEMLATKIKAYETRLEENDVSISDFKEQLQKSKSDNHDLLTEQDNLKRKIAQLSKDTKKQSQNDNLVDSRLINLINDYQESPEKIFK